MNLLILLLFIVGLMACMAVLVVMDMFGALLLKKAWSRLKGSRGFCYLGSGREAVCLSGVSRAFVRERSVARYWIEINHGFHRLIFSKTKIQGDKSEDIGWSIHKVRKTSAGGWRVHLLLGYIATGEDAVRLINKYPTMRSLMSDLEIANSELGVARDLNEAFRRRCTEQAERIAVLENRLQNMEIHRTRLLAHILGITGVLEADRGPRRYRSKFSEGLRLFLEDTQRTTVKDMERDGFLPPPPAMVERAQRFLKNRLSEVRKS